MLLALSAAVFCGLWLILWLPVLLAGAATTLFLWPAVALLGLGAWVVALLALVTGVVQVVQTKGRGGLWVVAASSVLLVVGPAALALGPISPIG